MAEILAAIKKKLSRLFLGRIAVQRFRNPGRPPLAIHRAKRTPEISPIRAQPRVGAAKFIGWKTMKSKVAGSILGGQQITAKGGRFESLSCRVFALNTQITKPARLKDATSRISRIPMIRTNRLQFLKNPPILEKARPLALYSPIAKERVAKSTLDKSTGQLLFFYGPERPSQHTSYHLILLRMFGAAEPLQWLWLKRDTSGKGRGK